jgi:hypothetical protein
MRKIVATVLTTALLASGCASAGGRIPVTAPPGGQNQISMGEYVQKIKTGSKVHVERTDGTEFRGTLMKATTDAIVVQANTRIPEPPVEVPVHALARVTIETRSGGSTAKAIGIGIASGVGVFLGIIAIFAASYD